MIIPQRRKNGWLREMILNMDGPRIDGPWLFRFPGPLSDIRFGLLMLGRAVYNSPECLYFWQRWAIGTLWIISPKLGGWLLFKIDQDQLHG